MKETIECNLGKSCHIWGLAVQYRNKVEDSLQESYSRNQMLDIIEAIIDGEEPK